MNVIAYIRIDNKQISLLLVAPDCIIYDNSCNLQSYCLNRDPGFFKNTMFLVDRFHWKNHTGFLDLHYLFFKIIWQCKALLSSFILYCCMIIF